MVRQSFLLLLRLNFRLAGRALQRGGVTRASGLAVSLIFLVPLSLSFGRSAEHWITQAPSASSAANRLILILGAIYAAWLLLRYIPEGLQATGAGRFSLSLLRTYPVSPLAVVLAEMVGSLADLPIFLLAPLLLAVGHSVSAGFVVSLAVFSLLIAGAGFIQITLRQAMTLLWRGRARGGITTALRVLLPILILAYAYARSNAFTPEQPKIRLWKPHTASVVKADLPAPFEVQTARWLTVTPAGLAAQTLDRRSAGWPAVPFVAFAGLAALTALSCATATWLTRLSLTNPDSGNAASGARFPARLLPARAYTRDTPGGRAIWEIGTIAAAEWRSLLRAGALHLPLRGPAMLIFTLVFCLMAPDMGPDALLNLRDVIGMGTILFTLLWQIQLLCNRFGNESGTAELLFSLPVSRRNLIIGRNLALGALLLIVDGSAILLLGAMADATPRIVSLLLLCLPVLLITTTALGNLLSILAPFPIRNREGMQLAEPGRGLASVYLLVGGVNALLLAALFRLPMLVRFPVGALSLAALYTGSVLVAERLLKGQEVTLIARLNAGGGAES